MRSETNLAAAEDLKFWQVGFSYAYTLDQRRVVNCVIVSDPPGEAYYGTAVCSKQDQFRKDKGRMLALLRATASWTREARGELIQGLAARGMRLWGKQRG